MPIEPWAKSRDQLKRTCGVLRYPISVSSIHASFRACQRPPAELLQRDDRNSRAFLLLRQMARAPTWHACTSDDYVVVDSKTLEVAGRIEAGKQSHGLARGVRETITEKWFRKKWFRGCKAPKISLHFLPRPSLRLKNCIRSGCFD